MEWIYNECKRLLGIRNTLTLVLIGSVWFLAWYGRSFHDEVIHDRNQVHKNTVEIMKLWKSRDTARTETDIIHNELHQRLDH